MFHRRPKQDRDIYYDVDVVLIVTLTVAVAVIATCLVVLLVYAAYMNIHG